MILRMIDYEQHWKETTGMSCDLACIKIVCIYSLGVIPIVGGIKMAFC
jgi:hypothetical protein